MTDEEAVARYKECFSGTGDWSDADWAAGCVVAVRRCVQAKNIDDAVRVLDRADWGDPVYCAMKLRGEKNMPKCPHCGGSGYLTVWREGRTSMNELRVPWKTFVKLHRLAGECASANSMGKIHFDEDRWKRGVKDILGYLPPPGEYRVVATDEITVRV